MGEDDRKHARELAAKALDDLLDPNAPVEEVVRQAMRVAALCKHPFWRAWLQLQLVDLTGKRDDIKAIEILLDTAFPDDRMSREVAARVYADYSESRDVGGGKIDGGPISEVEQLVLMADGLIQEGDNPGPKIFERVRSNRQVLSRVRTRIQQYLSNVESGDSAREGP